MTARPALLLLSGLLCDDAIWSDVVAKIPQADSTIVSFPGYASIEDMARHVLHSAPPRFALAGHSMGGRVALEVYRQAPQRVLGLALLNTGIHETRSTEAASRGRLVDIARTQGLSALADEWLPPMLFELGASNIDLAHRLKSMVARNSADSFAAQIQALLDRPEAASVLTTVKVPTLLLSATGDTWSPPEQHAAMRDLLPAATLVIVERAGHMTPAERPEAVAAALSEWLRRISAVQHGDLSTLDALLIAEQCRQQIYRYARLNDLGAWRALTALFTESGALYRPALPEVAISGREAILRSFEARPPRLSRHVVSNIEVYVETASRARAVSTLLLLTAESGSSELASTAVGHFHDELVRVDHEWLFAERRGSLVMRSPVAQN